MSSLHVDDERRRGRSKSPGRRSKKVDDDGGDFDGQTFHEATRLKDEAFSKHYDAPPGTNTDHRLYTRGHGEKEREEDLEVGVPIRETKYGREYTPSSRPYVSPEDDQDYRQFTRGKNLRGDREKEPKYASPIDDKEYRKPRYEDEDRQYRDKGDKYRSKYEPRMSGGLQYPGSADAGAMPYPEGDGIMMPGDGGANYDYDAGPRRPVYRTVSPPPESPYRSSKEKPDKYDDRGEARVRYAEYPDEEPGRSKRRDADDNEDGRLKFLPSKYLGGGAKKRRDKDSDEEEGYHRRRASSPPSSQKTKKDLKKERYEAELAYGSIPGGFPAPPSPTRYGGYDQPDPRDYGARVTDEDLSKYRRDPRRESDQLLSPTKRQSYGRYDDDPRKSAPNVLTVEPGSRDRDKSRDRRQHRDKSPQPPTGRMSMLSVNTGRESLVGLSASQAPGSPLLEAYHGTYQSISPMPSPLLLANQAFDFEGPEIRDVAPLEEEDKKLSRRARFHNPDDNAERLADALRGHGKPDVQPLIEILPGLTHEQVMELRSKYKVIVKTGSSGKGVNLAKHIRARLKDEDRSLMKACYAVALGRWESEAYWANFWYQGDKTRRELLIESLMGRSNDEIRMIKNGFSDKKYRDDLVECMNVELKEDKFKKAVMMVLNEKRMDDVDERGYPISLDYKQVDKDAEELRRAVKAEKGGETLMISIVVQRSDAHLKAILKEYTKAYQSNFARDALKKSGNLIGELLAHILNGVINRPVRDALLLNHAVTASRKDDLRRELLISRLVRLHWDRRHMAAVKKAYLQRYGKDLQEAVKECTSGNWGLFCRELCITRMPDDVKKIERLDVIMDRTRDKSRDRSRDRSRDNR